jgi:hypothetical protein
MQSHALPLMLPVRKRSTQPAPFLGGFKGGVTMRWRWLVGERRTKLCTSCYRVNRGPRHDPHSALATMITAATGGLCVSSTLLLMLQLLLIGRWAL